VDNLETHLDTTLEECYSCSCACSGEVIGDNFEGVEELDLRGRYDDSCKWQ
jgi:hypothetical protein